MKKNLVFIILTISLFAGIYGCKKQNLGTVCLGNDLNTLFESLPWETSQLIKKGDIIATKNPAAWLDFNYSVVYNNENTAFGKFAGFERNFLTAEGQVLPRLAFGKYLQEKKILKKE